MARMSGHSGWIVRTVSSPDTVATVQDMATVTRWVLEGTSALVDITPKGASGSHSVPSAGIWAVAMNGTFGSGNHEEWLNKELLQLELVDIWPPPSTITFKGWLRDWRAITDVDGAVLWSARMDIVERVI